MLMRGRKSHFIAQRSEAEKAAACDVTEITIVTKFFSGKCIAQVNFNKRNLNRQKGIAQRYAGVRKATGIQDDKFNAIDSSFLDAVDEFVFGVTLKTVQLMPKLPGDLDTAIFDVDESCRAVNIGFARAQQVQIGAINEQKRGHSKNFAAS